MATTELQVGYSTCPNDTFIFYPLVTGAVPCEGIRWKPLLADVESLNRRARAAELPVTKISFHAFGHVRQDYVLLKSGAALGRGCGPLLIAKSTDVLDRLETARIAIPGELTSAALLLRLYAPHLRPEQLVEMTFDRIFSRLLAGDVDAGLIIHESRFTYQDQNLVSLVDLGEWWEERSGLPIPLGGIIAQRSLGEATLERIDDALRQSVLYAQAHPSFCSDYIRTHAQELSEAVTRAHIDLYVNPFTVDLGADGRRAVEKLMRTGEENGILPAFGESYIR